MNLRLNVAAILRNHLGRILICERIKQPGTWQFPQGGVNKEESSERALARELFEEIGVRPHSYRIILRKGPYSYHYPGVSKKGYHGKEQFYFLCDFLEHDESIRVDTPHPEFRAFRWIEPREFLLTWLPEMKWEVYRAVFQDFFNLKI